MNVAQRIKELRKAKGISAETIAERLGTNPTTIYRYEKGDIEKMPISILEPIAEILGCSPAYLMGWEEKKDPAPARSLDLILDMKDIVAIPVLGKIAAGTPIYADENKIGTIYVSPELKKDDEIFALRVKGDSMIPRIQDGDILVVRKQEEAENGDIVCALINGDEACVKKLQKYKDAIALISLNPTYEPMHFTAQEVEQLPVRILGKVIEVRSKI
jgi:repressor LexA